MWRATADVEAGAPSVAVDLAADAEANAPADVDADAASALALNAYEVMGSADPATTAELPTAQQISDAYEARMAAEAGGAAGSGVGAIGAGAGGDGEGGGGERAESRYSMNVAVRFRLVSDKNLIEIL